MLHKFIEQVVYRGQNDLQQQQQEHQGMSLAVQGLSIPRKRKQHCLLGQVNKYCIGFTPDRNLTQHSCLEASTYLISYMAALYVPDHLFEDTHFNMT